MMTFHRNGERLLEMRSRINFGLENLQAIIQVGKTKKIQTKIESKEAQKKIFSGLKDPNQDRRVYFRQV